MKFFQSKAFLVALLVIAAGTAIYFMLAKPSTPGYIPKSTPDNCITMTRDEITNSWLSSGWQIPTDANYIPSIIFEPSVVGGNIMVSAYVVDKNCVEMTGKRINMTIGKLPTGQCSFPAGLTLTKTRYDFVAADVDPWGDLILFNFLRLLPQADPTDPTKLGFKVEFVKVKGTGLETPVAKGDTKPCPPYCPTQTR